MQLVAPRTVLRAGGKPRRMIACCAATGDRWKIERLFAWLHNFRRVVIRREYYPENFLGMVQLACAVILLRHL